MFSAFWNLDRTSRPPAGSPPSFPWPALPPPGIISFSACPLHHPLFRTIAWGYLFASSPGVVRSSRSHLISRPWQGSQKKCRKWGRALDEHGRWAIWTSSVSRGSSASQGDSTLDPLRWRCEAKPPSKALPSSLLTPQGSSPVGVPLAVCGCPPAVDGLRLGGFLFWCS